jgi:hypothetical protein
LGRSPNHHMCGSLLRARGFFITLLDLWIGAARPQTGDNLLLAT